MAIPAIGMWDYLVIAAMLLVSVAIGLYFRLTGDRQKTTEEYFVGGKNISKLPVAFSLTVTRLSSIFMLGEPAEVYLYGTQRSTNLLFLALAVLASAYMFLPVFFNIGGYSVHEYLQKRFGRTTRLVVSVFWSMQMVFYMAIVLYAPSLALSTMTNISAELSIVLLGLVATVYSSTGGLKAVIWTDLFQTVLMCACLLALVIQSVFEVGSFQDVWQIAKEGQRIEFFNMSPDLTVRSTFWNAMAFGLVDNAAFYAVNQAQIQRLLSVKSLSVAQSCLLWSILPTSALYILSIFVGLGLFSAFAKCNPLSKESGTGLFKSDQIVPYYIVTRMGSYPAVAGLCVAGIFSGSLSSLSSAINSLSAVAVVDFIGLKASSSSLMPKMISVFCGLAITGLAFVVYQLGSIIQVFAIITGTVQGPLLGVFCLGMFTTRANEKGVLVGLLNGILLSGGIGFLSVFKKYRSPPLPLSTEGCTNVLNATVSSDIFNASTTVQPNITAIASEPFQLHKISYMWVSTIGFLFALLMGYLASYAVEVYCKKKDKVDPRFLSPVARRLLGYTTTEKIPPLPEELEILG